MNDEAPAPESMPGGIRPMPVYLAVGWTMGALLVQILLVNGILGARTATRADLAKLFACQVAAYLLGIFLILRAHAPEAKIREFLAFRPTDLAFYPLAVLLGALLQIPAEVIDRAIVRRYPLEDHFLDGLAGDPLAQKLIFGLIVVILGPLLEEAFFRGALWKPLERAYASTPSFAILFSALLFATVHLSWHSFIPYWMLGLCMGFLRQSSGSLIPSLLLHGTFNGVTLYFAMIPEAGEGDPLTPLPRWLLAVGFGGAAVLLYLVHFIRRRSSAAARALELDLK